MTTAPVAGGRPRELEVAEPRDRAERRAIVPILADAFLDDPGWVAIGPRRSRRHRALANRASFWAIVHASARHGARIRVALRDGEVVGATIAFEPGRWPLPDRAALWELPWLLIAGPGPARRGLADDRAMRAAHIDGPHLYLWFIGVRPDLHSGGIGRVLMAELHAASERLGVPTFLETGTTPNLRFYESLGYQRLGELLMPSGSHLWQLTRNPSPAS